MQIYTTPLFSVDSFLRVFLDPGVTEEWSENSFLDIPSLLVLMLLLLLLTHTNGKFDLGYISKPYYFHLYSFPQTGCILLHLLYCVCGVLSHSVISDSLQPNGLYLSRVLCPWYFPGKNTRVGCHFLLLGSSWCRNAPALAGRFFTTVPPGKPWSENENRTKYR